MKKDVLASVDVLKLSKRFSGKLLLRKEIDLEETLFQQLLQYNLFQSVMPLKKEKQHITCLRCGNNAPHLICKYPCLICKKEHLYCRKCIIMGRISECELLYEWTGPKLKYPKFDEPCSWEGKLTPHQQNAADRLVSAIEKGNCEHLIWAVCGSGKTEMLFPGITKALQLGMRICIATPRVDVVRELLPRLKEAFKDVTIEGLYGESEVKEATAQLIVSTTHQLLRFKEAFDVMIVDEVDAFPYHADPALPFATNRAKKMNGTIVYLTATPREEQKERIKRNKLPHTFVPVRYHNNPLPVPQFKLVFTLRNQLYTKTTLIFFHSWLEANKTNRQILIFTPTIKLSEKVAQSLRKKLLASKEINHPNEIASVHSEDKEREGKIAKFRKKEIKVLITTTILERGVTFPSVDVFVFDAGHAVFDEAALVQIAGRAGRSADDPEGEVVFFHDGKTKAMVEAKKAIKQMNRRANFN